MATQMLQRRGTAAELAAENRILGPGEMCVEEDTERFKIGDGVTPWLDLDVEYLPKQTSDVLYSPIGAIPSSVIDADGDLLIGIADNTAGRLGKGAPGQRLTILPDGTLAWANLPVTANPFAVIDALGDLLVGSGPDAVARLPKGANGTVLTIQSDGTVGWVVATATDNTKVAKTGDTITGKLTIQRDSVDAGWGAANLEIQDPSGRARVAFHQPGSTACSLGKEQNSERIRTYNNAGTGYTDFLAGAIYDNGNRVYSPSNPPPAPPPGGAMINQTIRGQVGAATGQFGVAGFNTAKAQLRWLGQSMINGAGCYIRVVDGSNLATSGSGSGTISFEITEWT